MWAQLIDTKAVFIKILMIPQYFKQTKSIDISVLFMIYINNKIDLIYPTKS